MLEYTRTSIKLGMLELKFLDLILGSHLFYRINFISLRETETFFLNENFLIFNFYYPLRCSNNYIQRHKCQALVNILFGWNNCVEFTKQNTIIKHPTSNHLSLISIIPTKFSVVRIFLFLPLYQTLISHLKVLISREVYNVTQILFSYCNIHIFEIQSGINKVYTLYITTYCI